MTMGASRTTKLLGMDLDPRLTLNVATSNQCAATSQRISQLRCIAHKEAGPSPHDLRTFVIGYGASKLRYGSELIWAVATDSAKNEMQKTYATLARIVSGEALALHRHRSWILATDGGVDVPKSAGVGILLSSLNSSEIIEKASINCGTRHAATGRNPVRCF
ncbi:L1Tc protein [Trypanosoma cruzi]|nr:L1Tc protein [Trypanosoma cruzi]